MFLGEGFRAGANVDNPGARNDSELRGNNPSSKLDEFSATLF